MDGVAADADVAAAFARAAAEAAGGVVDGYRGFDRGGVDVVVADVEGVVHRRFVVMDGDGAGVGVVVGFEAADGVVADVECARPLAAQVDFVRFDVGQQVDAFVGVVVFALADLGVFVTVVVRAAEVGVGDDGVVADGYVVHRELVVGDAEADEAVAVGAVVFDVDVVAFVAVQPFAVVVVGGVACV